MTTETRFARPSVHVGAAVLMGILIWGCSGSDGGAQGEDTPSVTASPTTSAPADIAVTAGDFVNLGDMTPVRGFFVTNLAGDLQATLEVANSPDGGTYPVGTLIQLVPQEAMVKRAPGFSPAANDWEFFELSASEQGTEISVRGGVEVVNRFGGSCAGCHAQADPEWDLVCGTGPRL